MEAVVVDHHVMTIASLNPGSNRRVRVAVAGPGALLVSKVYKLAERADEPGRRRLETKDAFDVYRLLLLPSSALAVPLAGIRQDDRTARVGEFAILKLQELFDSAESLGSRLAGQHVAGTGDPDTVAAAASALAAELLRELDVGPAP